MERGRPAPLEQPDKSKLDLIRANSPTSPSPSRRRKKQTVFIKKTQEQIIAQSYEQLNSFIDNLDEQVKKVVQGHETQFLVAYRQHTKHVIKELQDIKRKNYDAMHENKHYIDRIETLEKQVILFREDSLRLSQKNRQLRQQVQFLTLQIKRLKQENFHQEQSLIAAIKENKQTAILVSSLKSKQPSYKNYEDSLNLTALPKNERNIKGVDKNERVFSMSAKTQSRKIQLGLESLKKEKKSSIDKNSRQISEIFDKKSKTIQLKDGLQQQMKSVNLSERKGFSNGRTLVVKSRQMTQKVVREEVKRLRSKQHGQRNQFQRVFVECIEEVRKQVMRKNKMNGLNFYKLVASHDYVKFKNADYHHLLYLFLSNERVLKTFFSLVSEQNGGVRGQSFMNI